MVDQPFNFVNARRRSNSSGVTNDINNFKTKFDVNEADPVFEETLHGPEEADEDDDEDLQKTDTASSEDSVDDHKSTKSA